MALAECICSSDARTSGLPTPQRRQEIMPAAGMWKGGHLDAPSDKVERFFNKRPAATVFRDAWGPKKLFMRACAYIRTQYTGAWGESKLMEAIQHWEGAMNSIATHREVIYAAALGILFTVAVILAMAGCLMGD